MRKGYRVSLLVIAILLAFSMTLGTSYAYWGANLVQTETNDVTTGCLKIEVNDEDINGNSTSINLTNAYPMNNFAGIKLKPYILTIKNVCTINAKYQIILNTLNVSTLKESEMRYHFVKTSPTETMMNPLRISSLSPLALEQDLQYGISEAVGVNINNSYEIGTGILNGQAENVTDSVTYNLRLWIDEAVGNDAAGKTFQAAIAVFAEAVE